MYSKLQEILKNNKIRINEEMKNHTTFKIGGPADVLVLPDNITDIMNTAAFCREYQIPIFILGLGSNILVTDKGIRGVVVKLGTGLNNISISGKEIYAESGMSIAELSRLAAENGLSGLEFAEGIPGSLGGAIVMNAGAYNGEMKDVLHEVCAVDTMGTLKTFKNEQMNFGYRRSIFQTGEYIVMAARIQLKHGNKSDIVKIMKEFAQRRQEKQPMELPSAGSAFKRPEGFYVGPIIEELGLKGFSIGGAAVSDKHAGFIVNIGGATAEDVLNLISYIQEKAKERYGVDLLPEIRVIGEK